MLHQIIYRFHKHILVFSLVLTLVAIGLLFKLKLDLNLFSLLPSDNPDVLSFFQVTEEIGIQSILIVSVEMPEDVGPAQSESFVEMLAGNIRQNPRVNEVEYKADTENLSALFQNFLKIFPLFMKKEDLLKLADKLSEKGIREQVLTHKRRLMTPFGIGEKYLFYEDPLSIREFLITLVETSYANRRIVPKTGYYRTEKGNTYFLFVKPTKPPQDVVFSKALMADMQEIKRRTKATWSDTTAGLANHIIISYTGGYPIAVDDEATTKKDIQVTLLTSFLGVMILFGVAFRTKKVILYVGIPLIISVLWTLGFIGLVFQHLNLLTCIFSCVLIGLGVDFAIHIVNRYFDNRVLALSLSERLLTTFEEAGMGVVIGGISTAAAFYALSISDFRGFKELGVMTGTGILICLVVMMFVLPSLLVLFSNTKDTEKEMVIAGFALDSVMAVLRKRPRTVVLMTVGAVCLLMFHGTEVTFDDNLKHFRSTDNETLRLQDQVTGWLRGSTSSVLLITKGSNEEQVLKTSFSILEALDGLVDSGMIAGIKSISQYFPLPSQQRESIGFVHRHPDIFDVKRIKKTFFEALEENGFEVLGLYDRYFERLSRAFSINEAILPSSIRQADLRKLLKPFVLQKAGTFKTITYIQPPTDLWSLVDTFRFKEMIIKTLDAKNITRGHYDLTGANLLTGELKSLILSNVTSALWLAGLSIVAVLILYYRSLKLFLLSMLPLLLGVAALFGIMVGLGLNFNLLNVMVLPMIIGIGIDDGVHLVNTYRRCRSPELPEALTKTGRAVVLTSLTTLVGFGSIALSHYPGLRSMGYVAVVGIAACMLSSIVVMPAVFSIIENNKHKPLA